MGQTVIQKLAFQRHDGLPQRRQGLGVLEAGLCEISLSRQPLQERQSAVLEGLLAELQSPLCQWQHVFLKLLDLSTALLVLAECGGEAMLNSQ